MVFFAFMFHFYVSTYWLSILLKAETCDFYVSFLVSMFHSKNTVGEKQKHCGSDSKTLWERESAPSVFWKVKHGTKNETSKSYVFSKKGIRNSQSNMQTTSISSQNRTKIQSLQNWRNNTYVKKVFFSSSSRLYVGIHKYPRLWLISENGVELPETL